MYQKNIFLFYDESYNYLHKNILPLLESDEGLLKMFANESLILKKFIFLVECHIDAELSNKDKKNSLFSKLRNKLIFYLSKLLIQDLKKREARELYLTGSCIGDEGSQIISMVLKLSNTIKYIDFSDSHLRDEELEIILKAVENIDDFFSINFLGVNISLKILKYIAKIKSNKYKLEILTDSINNISKMTLSNLEQRKFKYKKKNNK